MKSITRVIAAILLTAGLSVAGATSAQASTPKWLSISAGDSHTCAIATNHALYCWGFNGNGQLGLGDTTGRTTPTRVDTGTGWVSVSAGGTHTCARHTSGAIYCWGNNGDGQLGLGDTANRTAPQEGRHLHQLDQCHRKQQSHVRTPQLRCALLLGRQLPRAARAR